MITILLLLSPAAHALDCAEVQNMIESGLPSEAIADAILSGPISTADVDCLVQGGAPEAVIHAAQVASGPTATNSSSAATAPADTVIEELPPPAHVDVQPPYRSAVSIGIGKVLFEERDGKMAFYVRASWSDGFWCSNESRKELGAFASHISEAARYRGVNAALGNAKRTAFKIHGAGYCNASSSFKDGVHWVTFVTNPACFGSAGCDSVTMSFSVPDVGELVALASAFEAAANH